MPDLAYSEMRKIMNLFSSKNTFFLDFKGQRE